MVVGGFWWLLNWLLVVFKLVFGGCWWLLVVVGGCWWLLVVVCGFWWLLVVVGGCLWLLVVVGGCWWLLNWLLLIRLVCVFVLLMKYRLMDFRRITNTRNNMAKKFFRTF